MKEIWDNPIKRFHTTYRIEQNDLLRVAVANARWAIEVGQDIEITDTETGEVYFITKHGNVEYIQGDFAKELFNI